MVEIEKFNPRREAIVFRKKYKTFKEAWKECHRGDWMLWIASRLGTSTRILTRAKAHCALTVKHLMKDKRSINACEVALKFADKKATRQELHDAAYAAYAAYADAAAADSWSAYAADAAAADAAADAAAAYAADAAYAAADAAAAAANRKQTADICRKYLTRSVFKLI